MSRLGNPSRFGGSEIRLAVLGGIFLGLAAATYWPAAEVPEPVGIDAGAATVLVRDKASTSIARAEQPVRVADTDTRNFIDPGGGGTGDRVEMTAVTGPVRVIDGDTFDYGGERIRVADIDTPELRGRCAHEIELAARATSRMRALLAEGPFELHPTGDRDEDQYGRKLRIVTRGGQSLGDMLVAEGLARTWTGRREPWCV